jgi:hypothetical protein
VIIPVRNTYLDFQCPVTALGTKLTVPSAVIYRSDRNYKTNKGAYLKAARGPTGGVDYYWL